MCSVNVNCKDRIDSVEVIIEGGYTTPADPLLVVQKNEQNEREQKSIVFC